MSRGRQGTDLELAFHNTLVEEMMIGNINGPNIFVRGLKEDIASPSRVFAIRMGCLPCLICVNLN